MKNCLIALLLSLAACTAAQNSLQGTLTSEDQKPVADVHLQLLKAGDSSLVKNEFSDEQGQFRFENLPAEKFLLLIQAPGFQRQTLNIDDTIPADLGTVTLSRSVKELQEVAVVSKKPYIEREKGKLILNVESSINAEGASAYELLEKAPGVRIDNNENISVNGKPGTQIWIDGKPSPMSASDLANLLRGMASSNIEKIEIISNPGSRYDAAGSSIINIRMKKDKRIGTNGSISTTYLQGIYPKSVNTISLNHRNKKINVYASYNFNYRQAFSHLKLDRNFFENDSFTGAFVQDNYLRFDFKTHVARAGVDWNINRKNSLGIMVSAVSNRFNPTGQNVSHVFDHTGSQSSTFGTSNRSRDQWRNMSANLNYKHVFDSAGTELTTDMDMARYGNTTVQNFETRYYDLSRTEYLRPYLLHGDLNGALHLYAIKNDFSRTILKNHRLEAGQKSSYVKADNELAFYDRSFGGSVYDSTKSNHFIYSENINAGYLNLSGEHKKFTFQLGVRVEHTNASGRQLVYNTSFVRNYVQLFPSGFIGYKVNEKHNLEINYSKRIRRPSYEQLNPFKFYLDPTTYKEGNPYLRPELTDSYELIHTFKQKINSTLSYARTVNNIIETIAPLEGQQKVTVQTNRNLALAQVLSYNLSLPAEIKKWWSLTTNMSVYYAGYTGNIANTQLNNKGSVNLNLNTVNNFNMNQTLSAELSFNYNSREVYAYDLVKPIWFMSAGIQKKIMEGRGTLRINANDIFYTNKIRATVNYTGYTEHFVVRRDTRVVTFSFTYKFGKSTVAPARRRQGAADDIKQRAGNTNG